MDHPVFLNSHMDRHIFGLKHEWAHSYFVIINSSGRAQALELGYNSGDLGGQIIDKNQAFKDSGIINDRPVVVPKKRVLTLQLNNAMPINLTGAAFFQLRHIHLIHRPLPIPIGHIEKYAQLHAAYVNKVVAERIETMEGEEVIETQGLQKVDLFVEE